MNKRLSIAFLGTLVPDEPMYNNIAFARSGNTVQEGIVLGLREHKIDVTVLSQRPIASFPKNRILFCFKKTIIYRKSTKIILVPFINLKVIKTIFVATYDFFSLITWAINNRRNKRCILVYNPEIHPLPLVHLYAKMTMCKSVAILYDLGMPPKSLKLGRFRTLLSYISEFFTKKIVSHLDGRIVINENVVRDYAPNSHYLLIDGGINEHIVSKLFDLKLKSDLKKETIFLCAGTLWPINGTMVIMEALKINKNPCIKVWFAGSGIDQNLIESAQKNDLRIKYLGKLDINQLFAFYEEADVLMNIRVTEPSESLYLFPSKIFEYLATGKYVLTTSTAHLNKTYGHLCHVLKDNDPHTLAQAMNEIANMPKNELLNRGRIARQFILKNRTWDIQSTKILNYIEFIVNI